MPRFLLGDEQGQIKSLTYGIEKDPKYRLTTLSRRVKDGQKSSIQRLAGVEVGGSKTVLAAYSDGNLALSNLQDDEKLDITKEWKEPRFKKDSAFIGLVSNLNKIYSCTSNGALQITSTQDILSDTSPSFQRLSLPTRLHDWKLSPNGSTFAYGGDEVDVSVWDTEVAFQTQAEDSNNSSVTHKKRKRKDDLFPGEVWRAKNVANDSLGLRQPVRITSIDYLSTGSSGHHIVTGTQLGDIRRYDTRAARRPITDWKGVGKVGGIQVVKKGLHAHELFASDCGTNLFSIDLRNGRTICAYKGLSGAVTSIAPSSGIMASTANDRYARIHSTFPPPAREGQNIDRKGEVSEKIYVASMPTVVIWDYTFDDASKDGALPSEEDDDVWNDLEEVGDSDAETGRGKKRRS
ncbi:hypothetical protein Agabi119p4_3112 [Agaricus bisporus var. burnettii]|uniref:Ribosome biogenesis protein NSA1 n=1 Tax=Agaricus bisporus var. burnettii TaxID=192524 RepID=A0A8H7F6H0_AGABI|nr:hypothetical protein Agabi119p4_3112 [Agaricus bisporus var. burnettii]